MIYSYLQWKAPQRYQRHLLKDVETQCLFQTVQFLDFSDFSAASSIVFGITARALPRYAKPYPCAVLVHILYPVELWDLYPLAVHNQSIPLLPRKYTLQTIHRLYYSRGIKGQVKLKVLSLTFSLIWNFSSLIINAYYGLTTESTPVVKVWL